MDHTVDRCFKLTLLNRAQDELKIKRETQEDGEWRDDSPTWKGAD